MKTIFLNILILLSGSPCFAGGTEGATPFNFLFTNTAKAEALGGAYAAMQGSAETLLYNPAGLSKIENNEIIFGYASHIKDINQKYLGIAFKKGYGAMIKSVYSDKI
ncbi:MAG: hypothetical protein HY746_10480, partial [Elusimicrobia bacterium]|nr:hypothetical protein [Elusimicrobiota bacterium]